MKKYTYKKIDAFTSGDSLGNPAACLFLGNEILTPEEMLLFGQQHNGFVSEVVFCSDSEKAECKLTYYSSECEVDFCGHGTIATMFEYIRNDAELLERDEILVDTNKKGELTVYNRIRTENAIYITAPKAQYLEIPVSLTETAEALGLKKEDISECYPLDFIDAGLRTLIVPVSKLDKEVSVFPDEVKLKEFCIKKGINIILIFSKETSTSGFVAHTRVFAPKFGYLEDPATGSGNSAFGNYMIKHGIWDGSPVSVEQGGNDRVFNVVRLATEGEKILFGGSATLRIEGNYYF